MDYFKMATDDWPDERKADLLEAIQSEVLTQADDDGEHGAINALREFERPGFDFSDWDSDSRTWTHRFLWCCYALEWAIDTYDAAKGRELMLSKENIRALAAVDRAMDEGVMPFVRDEDGRRWAFPSEVLEIYGCTSGQTASGAVILALMEANLERLTEEVKLKAEG